MESHAHSPLDSHVGFQPTEWNLVCLAGSREAGVRETALDKLCQCYWPAIYSYLRRTEHSPAEAEDLTQEFFFRLLRNGSIANADPARGRFRSFLLGALHHFLADEWKHRTRERRGGFQVLISLDEQAGEALYQQCTSTELPPDKVYDRAWWLAFVEHCMSRLGAEYDRAGKSEFFKTLSPFLTADPDKGEYLQIARQFEMKPATIAVAIHRLRKHFRGLVHAEAARTIPNLDELEDELRSLASLFSS